MTCATAGTFTVNPVRATLTSNQSVQSLVVHNNGTEPSVVQVETVSWTQQDGKDIYGPTREILATPPIFTVPPGGSQVVRVGLRRGIDPQRELTYRLFLQEVPSAAQAELKGLQVVLRVGIPVFVVPDARTAPALRWRVGRTVDGTLKVSATNNGNAHVQVAKLTLTQPESADPVFTQGVATYVLPGQTRDWVVKLPRLPAAGASLRIAAQTDAGDMNADIVME
jgi:fimbrial chaperone protein